MGPLRSEVWGELNPAAEEPHPDMVQRTTLELARYGERFGGFNPARPFEVSTYLYIPDPHRDSIPVHVWVDDRPDLTVEQATSDEDAIEPPVSRPFTFHSLGLGLKTVSHGVLNSKPGDPPGGWVTVRYAFAVPGRHAIVTVKATETDPARMEAAANDLDEFVASTTLSLADNTPYVIDGAASTPDNG